MSRTTPNDFETGNASVQQQDCADAAKLAADAQSAEQKASDHRDQIRSLARAAVQAMVTSHRKA